MDPEVTRQSAGVRPNAHDLESLASMEKTPSTHGGDSSAGDVEGGNSILVEPKPAEQVAPDGGLQAWLCVLGAFLCQFSSFGFLNACGIFQTYYELELLKHNSSSSITWIITIQIFLMFFLGPIIGISVDALGPRKIIIASSVVSVFGICMLSLCHKYWHVLLAQGIVYGIGAAGLFLPGLVATGQWFSSKRGLATGLVSSGSSVGGVVFPFMVTGLIEKRGFPAAVRYTALMLGLLLAIACLCVSAPFPPKGLADRKTGGAQAFRSLSWIGYTLGCFFIVWGLFAPFNYLPLMALKANFSPGLANYSVSIMNAAAIPGRIVPAYLSDHFGQFNSMSLVALASGTAILAFWLPLELHPNHAAILVFAACYGFASGGFVSLMTPCVVALSKGRVDELGARLGAFFVVIALAALTGLPILGAILDKNPNSFVGLMVFSGVVMTMGGVFILGVRIRMGGLSLAKKV
ncbi:MFS transporter [Tirmania nivea]|nr:MFS transporter [Tirmania nivea]